MMKPGVGDAALPTIAHELPEFEQAGESPTRLILSNPVIRARGVGKRYRLGQGRAWRQGTLRDELAGAWGRLRARREPAAGEFWALRDVDFEVEQGECVGIVGRNGAGKSTLLKILSRITEPTTGRVELRGRVASLLEVGTGFHPELTGRENVYLNGAVLGMRRAEISRNFDEIVSFAEVDRFLDTPVKRYSSGMYTRLAFSVAAHLTSEILVVDEVLAVGDTEFQRKCLGKMDEVARAGRTVLFVSHNMLAVERLCQRAFLLDSGRLAGSGTAREVIASYLGQARRPCYEGQPRAGRPHFVHATLDAPEGRPVTSAPLDVVVDWAVPEPCHGLRIGIGINSADGIRIFGSAPEDAGVEPPSAAGHYRAVVRIPRDLLLAGEYGVALALWSAHEVFEHIDPAFGFHVEPGPSLAYAKDDGRAGLVQVACRWTLGARDAGPAPHAGGSA